MSIAKPKEQIPLVAWQSNDKESRLYHGDSLQVMQALPAETVDCIWTDPPYNLSNDGITCVAGRMVKVNKGEWDRSRGVELDHEFNKTWLAACYRLLKPTGTIWVSGTMHVYPSVGFALQELGFRILNDIIWEKPAPPRIWVADASRMPLNSSFGRPKPGRGKTNTRSITRR